MKLSGVLVVAVVLAGCSAEADNPVITGFPPRPAVVDLDRVPPCSLLSDLQQTELVLDSGRAGVATVNGLPSPVCTWLGSDGIDYNVQRIPLDAATALTARGATISQIAGFGAVTDVPPETMGGTPICQVTVDAAAGQSVRVQARTRPRGFSPGISEQCRRATVAASMVMTTVVATASR